MAEASVIFRDNQELEADDLNNQQKWMSDALDHVVLDTINGGKAYAGFAITKSATTVCSVSNGRLYSGGAVYARNELVALDFYNDLPVTTQRQMAIVVSGQTINEDIQPRDFLIDADTGQSQPQAVAMQATRYCNVTTVRGVESSNPQYPSVDASLLLVGYVLLDATGIVSFQQVTDTQVDNLADVGNRTGSLEAWKTMISGSIATLTTDLANLAKQFSNYVLLADYQKLVDIVNELYKKVFQPGAFIWYGTDNFLDETLSDTDATLDGAYAASIHEGLRFPGSNAETTTTLQLLNPTDPQVLITNGFMLPMPSGSRVRLDASMTGLPWVSDRILQYTYRTFTVRHLTCSRHRFRCGPHWVPCPPSQVWWYQAQLDPTTHILSMLAETWEAVEWGVISAHCNDDSPDWPRHSWQRNKYFWRDYTDRPYWSKVNTSFSHSGQEIAQPFLNAQDGWLTSVTIYLMAPYYQPLTLMIAGTDPQDAPDAVNQTVCRVNLSGADLQSGVEAPMRVGDIEVIEQHSALFGLIRWKTVNNIPVFVYPCRISVPPTFLKAGEKYSLHIVSTYDHAFGVCQDFSAFQVCQAGLWTCNGGRLVAWPAVQNPKVLRFKLHYATWGRWPTATGPGDGASQGGLRYDVDLQPLQMAGGIGGVDVLAEHIIPAATDLSYAVQIGGTWYPFAQDTDAPSFATNPALVPFRVTFTGTTDLMPGVSLTPSQVTVHGGTSNAFHHISTGITLGSASTHVKIIGKLLNFVSAHHTCAASIHYGTTHKTADVVGDVLMDDGVTLERTWTFNSLPNITEFVAEMDGTTDGTGDTFIVAQEIRYATA